MLILLVGSLAFVADGLLMAREEPIAGYACVAFFGLCALVGAISLHPKSSFLELRADGFEYASLFRRTFVQWRHISQFFPITVHHNAMVGWNYSPEFTDSSAARKVAAALSGAEAALPDTYGMKAAELATLLNSFLARYHREP